ncbi:hypothetical protein V9T40_008604 [Parthenolecanium corni]|uniref:Uncharacterized protein n=1 Tax=Parthenolecanium corni TaxID=536013 RepID=A0AAN9U040_9HEMI
MPLRFSRIEKSRSAIGIFRIKYSFSELKIFSTTLPRGGGRRCSASLHVSWPMKKSKVEGGGWLGSRVCGNRGRWPTLVMALRVCKNPTPPSSPSPLTTSRSSENETENWKRK